MARRLLLFLTLAIAAFIAPLPAEAAELDDEAQFVVLINELRASLGLTPLEVHPELVGPSRSWAAQLSSNGELSHAADLSVGVTTTWTMLGENVGVASIDQTQALFDAFVASPGHYQNLVNPDFRYVGVGVVYDSGGQMWTTHRFMAVTAGGATTTPPTSATTSPPATNPPTTVAPNATPTTASPAAIPTTPVPGSDPPAQLAFTDGTALAPGVIVSVVEDMALSTI